MLKKIKNLIFGKQPNTVKPTHRIFIKDDTLHCVSDFHAYSFSVSLKVLYETLEFAYVLVDADGFSCLFISDPEQQRLPCDFDGFEAVYQLLSEHFGFDDVTFRKALEAGQPTKQQIWRKQHPQNYERLSTQHDDFAQGFEVQTPQKNMISWDTTYAELIQFAFTHVKTDKYGLSTIYFDFPVRVGNLLLADFTLYNDNPRKDVPPDAFHTRCYDVSNTDVSFHELITHLQAVFSKEEQTNLYARHDQTCYSFSKEDMTLELVYTYDSKHDFRRSYTSLNIRNHRDYPELLIDADYENCLEVSKAITFDTHITMPENYKRKHNVKRRPPNLTAIDDPNHNVPMLWVDEKNNKIGFADSTYSQVFDKNSIVSITITNMLPAKGSGGAFFEIQTTDGNYDSQIFVGGCHEFDSHKNQIASLTGIKVISAPDFYNC